MSAARWSHCCVARTTSGGAVTARAEASCRASAWVGQHTWCHCWHVLLCIIILKAISMRITLIVIVSHTQIFFSSKTVHISHYLYTALDSSSTTAAAASSAAVSVVSCPDCNGPFELADSVSASFTTHARVLKEQVPTLDWKKKHCRVCPKCQTQIFRDGGCSHITCRMCKYQFCWICLGPYQSGRYSYNDKCPCQPLVSQT